MRRTKALKRTLLLAHKSSNVMFALSLHLVRNFTENCKFRRSVVGTIRTIMLYLRHGIRYFNSTFRILMVRTHKIVFELPACLIENELQYAFLAAPSSFETNHGKCQPCSPIRQNKFPQDKQFLFCGLDPWLISICFRCVNDHLF